MDNGKGVKGRVTRPHTGQFGEKQGGKINGVGWTWEYTYSISHRALFNYTMANTNTVTHMHHNVKSVSY